jgi:DNA replication and repair protein RecF
MFIKNLFLKNFRNYSEEEFNFSDGLNVLFGKNAQGKTNCAEAVFYLCTGTSPRAKRDKQLIKNGESKATIIANCNGIYGDTTISADIYESSREVKVNGNKITRNADILGNVYAVFFSPQELRLIQDGPDERRRFLNISLSQTSRTYYTSLLRYKKILEQRNNLLKNRDISMVYDTLPVWDEQLCTYGAKIAIARTDFIKKLSPLAKEVHAHLTEGQEELVISPEKKYKGDEQELKKKLYDELSDNYDRDIRLGFTATGPHRDDLDIKINGAANIPF